MKLASETGTVKIAIMAPLVTAIREPQRGGSQAFVSDLARGLAGRGHEVHVYAASGSEIPGVEVIDTGIDPAVPGGHVLPGVRAIRGRRERPGPARRPRRPSPRSPPPMRPCGRPGTTWSTITPSTRPPSRSRRRCTHRWCTRSTCLRTRRCRRRFVRWPGAASRRRWPPSRISRPAPGAGSSPSTRSCRRTRRVGAIPWSGTAGPGALFAGRLSPEKGAAEAIDIARAAGSADRRLRRRLRCRV